MARVEDCVQLIEKYVAGELGAWDFCLDYVRAYKELSTFDERLFQPLETVFGVAEGYDPSITDATATVHDFTENTLRTTCQVALGRLREIGLNPSDD